jgi:hypothetical protein
MVEKRAKDQKRHQQVCVSRVAPGQAGKITDFPF